MKGTIKMMAVAVGSSSLLSLLTLGVLGGGMAAAGTAISPAGSYNATITFTGDPSPIVVSLTLTAKGHFSFPGGASGTWTEKNTSVTMVSHFEGSKGVWRVQQSGKNLGSAAHQGTWSSNGSPQGTWYAMRVPKS